MVMDVLFNVGSFQFLSSRHDVHFKYLTISLVIPQ